MSIRRNCLAAGLAAILATPAAVHADSITINGRSYDDVLVYKSPSIYYVKIPQEGRVISTPVERIDASSVVIDEDPYYREQLKEQFEQAKADVAAGKQLPSAGSVSSAFDVPESSGGGDFDSSALYGGAGKPLGMSQQEAEGVLKSQGFTFTGMSGKTGDGILSVQLQGPPEDLTGVVITATGQQAQLMGAMPKMFGLISQKAPWVQGWLQQNMQALMTGQPIQNVQNGVYLGIAPAQNGANVSIVVTMRGA